MIYDSCDDTSASDRQLRSRQGRRDSASTRSASSDEREMIRLLKRLDTRGVPKLEVFDENSGQSLEKYLARFEDYCRGNFKGRRYLWIDELERHLTGRMLDNFRSLRNYDNNYSEVKRKMMSWYHEEEEVRRIRARGKFEKAKPKPGESMYIFSYRLENLYRLAFPNNDVRRSTTLIYRFKAAVNKPMRELLNSQIMSQKMHGKRMSWRLVQKCARVFEVDVNMQEERNSDGDRRKEVVINLSAGRDMEEKSKKTADQGGLV